MDYETMRSHMALEKTSHLNKVSDVIDFGAFSVISLSSGGRLIVDPHIAEKIKHRRWSIDPSGYAKTDLNVAGKRETVRLHDYVMATVYGQKPEKAHIDHINGSKLDNRVCNLRIVTPSYNQRNVRRSEAACCHCPHAGNESEGHSV